MLRIRSRESDSEILERPESVSGVGHFGEIRVGVGVGHFTSDSATLLLIILNIQESRMNNVNEQNNV